MVKRACGSGVGVIDEIGVGVVDEIWVGVPIQIAV